MQIPGCSGCCSASSTWEEKLCLLEADAWAQEASGERGREASSREWLAEEGSRRWCRQAGGDAGPAAPASFRRMHGRRRRRAPAAESSSSGGARVPPVVVNSSRSGGGGELWRQQQRLPASAQVPTAAASSNRSSGGRREAQEIVGAKGERPPASRRDAARSTWRPAGARLPGARESTSEKLRAREEASGGLRPCAGRKMRARESGRAPSGSCGRDAIDQSIGEG